MADWTRQEWGEIRKRGRRNYVVVRGLRTGLFAGLGFWAVFTVALPYVCQGPILSMADYAAEHMMSAEFMVATVFAFLAFPAIGYLRSAWEWRRNEQRVASGSAGEPPQIATPGEDV